MNNHQVTPEAIATLRNSINLTCTAAVGKKILTMSSSELVAYAAEYIISLDLALEDLGNHYDILKEKYEKSNH